MTTTTTAAAQYNDFFGGYVAFKYGQVVRDVHGAVKVFQSHAAAEKAAKSSKMTGAK